MPSKPKKVKRPTWLEVWKGTRKDPTPPGRAIWPKNRDLIDDLADEEMGEGESSRCVFCGELRFGWEFEDGLRCVYCVEEDEG